MITTYPISKQGEREYKIHLISHIFKQMKFLGIKRDDSYWNTIFDKLYDTDVNKLVDINVQLEVEVKRLVRTRQQRINETLYWRRILPE